MKMWSKTERMVLDFYKEFRPEELPKVRRDLVRMRNG